MANGFVKHNLGFMATFLGNEGCSYTLEISMIHFLFRSFSQFLKLPLDIWIMCETLVDFINLMVILKIRKIGAKPDGDA